MKQQTIQSGNRAVVITEDRGRVSATLWVNARAGIENADITSARWVGRTVAGAVRWAARHGVAAA